MNRKPQFSSLQAAFEALPDDVREHSLRVEKYADLIFMEVCASDEYIMNINSRVRLRYENRTMIGMAARYHDIGKILVPSVYHWADEDFSLEETALYLRHSQGGEQFARDLLKDQIGVVPMLIDTVCEGVSAHHEWWDGTGTPKKAKEEDIPIVGRIVAVADELDHLLMETRTETPVATAMDKMMSESGTRFDPIIMGLMYEVKYKIEKIFALYRQQSRAVPQTPHIIRRKKRPMWLKYRPILSMTDRKMVAIEADMVFHRGRVEIPYSEAEHLLKETKLVWDAQISFVIEACDMIKRMRNCEIDGEFVALNCVTGFWKKKGVGKTIAQLLENIDADPASICFILKGDAAKEPTTNVIENCEKLREAGCLIMYCDVPVNEINLDTVLLTKATHIALRADDLEEAEKLPSKLRKLANNNITVLGDHFDKHRHFEALEKVGIAYAVGDLIGEYETENEFIAEELALVEGAD